MKFNQFLLVLSAVLVNAAEETERKTQSTMNMVYYTVRVTTDMNIPTAYQAKTGTIETEASRDLYQLAEPYRRALRADQTERRLFNCSLCAYMTKATCVLIYGGVANGCRRVMEETISEEEVEEQLSRNLVIASNTRCDSAIQSTKSEMLKVLGQSGLDWYQLHGTFQCYKEYM